MPNTTHRGHWDERSPLRIMLLPILLFLFLWLLSGGAYVAVVVADNYMSNQERYCRAAAEARAAGVLLDTVVVEPRLVRYGGYEVEFGSCWAEQLRESQRPAWYARRRIVKSFNRGASADLPRP